MLRPICPADSAKLRAARPDRPAGLPAVLAKLDSVSDRDPLDQSEGLSRSLGRLDERNDRDERQNQTQHNGGHGCPDDLHMRMVAQ